MVIATQNPLDHEGTYPLPESQLDRFLIRLSLGYPDRESELKILDTYANATPIDGLQPVVSLADIGRMAAAVRGVHVAPALKGYLVDLAAASRAHRALSLGMSPRATLAMQKAIRASAAAQGRAYATPDDVKAIAVAVLAHRVALSPDAQLQHISSADVVNDLLKRVPVPSARA